MIALNYIYLTPKHAGGKDQVGINLLRGLHENGLLKNFIVICYDYSERMIRKVASDVKLVLIDSHTKSELSRILKLYYINTFVLPKIIEKYKIRVVCHLSLNNGFTKLKVCSVVIPHDIKQITHRKLGKDIIPFYKYYPYRLMYYMDFLHADKIIAISDFDKSDMCSYYNKFQNKIVRIYNPVLIQEKQIREKTNSIGKYIVAVNLQFHHKNIITLLKAFEIIKDQVQSKLVLIGNVPTRVKYLKEYVKDHNLEELVIFTGFVNDDEKYTWVKNASLYINPTKFEGFGMTAIEAMLLEVPTLVSNIPANYEVTKGLCDYYEPVEDEHALAEKIMQCLQKGKNKKELSEIREQIKYEYDYLNISKKYFSLLSEMEYK